MGGARVFRSSECPRLLADAATTRRRRGLPQRSPYSATCSDKCEGRREARFRRQARERGYRLEPGSGSPYYALQRERDQARSGRAPGDGVRLHSDGLETPSGKGRGSKAAQGGAHPSRTFRRRQVSGRGERPEAVA